MNKKILRTILSICIVALLVTSCSSTAKNISANGWLIEYNHESKTLDYTYNGNKILSGVYARAKVGNDTLQSNHYEKATITQNTVSDIFGKGEKFTIEYVHPAKPDLKQVFYFYSNKEYFMTELFVESDKEIMSNYMAPIYSTAKNSFLPADKDNRVLSVPFDNDAFVHYFSSPLTVDGVSFEVTSIFNGANRNGLVLGSVEHSTWKTGIKYKGEEEQYISKLECYGGITHELTRDISDREDRPSAQHGSIKGKSLKSPKIFFGFFTDWRRGMEQFGETNAIIAPPRQWTGGTPFGWNSWAAMAEKVNYEGAVDVADFIKNELQPNGFENNNVTYIGLDSFWDNFSSDQLREYAKHCQANGQKAGIYWCPFSDWFGNAEADVEGTNGEYKYKDIYLYANGTPRKIESLAVDPTHPATKKRIDHYIGMFKELGYSYVKLDFINNGTLEADSFYNPKVTTGVQAYNEGMEYLSNACGDMFMALSIAPTFPTQYGTSKRISCDAWGSMTEKPYGSTGYMLNSLSFGWWLDRVYPFNDADHMLLYKPEEAEDYKEGANRARITSAAITGIFMLGDNLSLKGSLKGSQKARDKAKTVTSNTEINDIARIGKSFYPVEGYLATATDKSENFFMYHTDAYLYVVVFNFDAEKEMTGLLNLTRLSIVEKDIKSVKELWTDAPQIVEKETLAYSVPPQDVCVYKIEKLQH